MPAKIDEFPLDPAFKLIRGFQMRQDEMEEKLFELLVNIFIKTTISAELSPDDAARLALGKNQVVKFMKELDTLQEEFTKEFQKLQTGGNT